MSHFGDMNTAKTDTWAGFKALADDAGAGTLFYCEHGTHYSMVVPLGEICFLYALTKTDPASADQTDFENNYKGGATLVD
jgi:hypothetical protein